MSKKVGRNDPCPCGSGKKYKKCCGTAGAEEPEEEKLEDVRVVLNLPPYARADDFSFDVREDVDKVNLQGLDEEDPEDLDEDDLEEPESLDEDELDEDELDEDELDGDELDDDKLNDDDEDDEEGEDVSVINLLDGLSDAQRAEFFSMQSILTGPDAEEKVNATAGVLVEILRTDPAFFWVRLLEDDVAELMALGFSLMSKPEEQRDAEQENRLEQLLDSEEYIDMASDCIRAFMADFCQSHDPERKLTMIVALADLEYWLGGGNEPSPFWRIVASATFDETMQYQIESLAMIDLTLRHLVTSPEAGRALGLEGLTYEQALNKIEGEPDLGPKLYHEVDGAEGELIERIDTGTLVIDLPDDWAFVALALAAHFPDLDRSALDEELETMTSRTVAPQLDRDVQAAFRRILAERQEAEPLRVPLAVFTEKVPKEPLSAVRYLSSASVLQKSRRVLLNRAQYESQRTLLKEAGRTAATLNATVDAALSAGDLTRAAALAVAGTVVFDSSADDRHHFALRAREIAAEPDEGEE